MKELKLQELSDKEHIYSGVYMIVFPNDKRYIGISNNIRRRMNEHNVDFRNNLPIESAIKKYGKINNFILLEEIYRTGMGSRLSQGFGLLEYLGGEIKDEV